MTHQFALKQDVRTPNGVGFIVNIDEINLRVQVSISNTRSPWFKIDDVVPLAPIPGQEIEVRDAGGIWVRAWFVGLIGETTVAEINIAGVGKGIGHWSEWRFIPEPKPSTFTAEQLAELDKRYARREDA